MVVVYVAMRACMVWVQFAFGAWDVPWWVGPTTYDTDVLKQMKGRAPVFVHKQDLLPLDG